MRICVVGIEETKLDEISRIDKATVCASRIQLGNFLIIGSARPRWRRNCVKGRSLEMSGCSGSGGVGVVHAPFDKVFIYAKCIVTHNGKIDVGNRKVFEATRHLGNYNIPFKNLLSQQNLEKILLPRFAKPYRNSQIRIILRMRIGSRIIRESLG